MTGNNAAHGYGGHVVRARTLPYTSSTTILGGQFRCAPGARGRAGRGRGGTRISVPFSPLFAPRRAAARALQRMRHGAFAIHQV